MEGNQTAPGLPAACFATLSGTGETVIIKRGERGYSRFHNPTILDARALNQLNGINDAQAEAMLDGSMLGWDVPGADPGAYSATGRPVRSEPAKRSGRVRESR